MEVSSIYNTAQGPREMFSMVKLCETRRGILSKIHNGFMGEKANAWTGVTHN